MYTREPKNPIYTLLKSNSYYKTTVEAGIIPHGTFVRRFVVSAKKKISFFMRESFSSYLIDY